MDLFKPLSKRIEADGGHLVPALAFASFFFSGLGIRLMNQYLFPACEGVLPFAADLSTLAGALLYVGVAVAMLRRPSVMRPGPFTVAAVALAVGGPVVALASLGPSNRVMVGLSMSLAQMGSCWLSLVELHACCRLGYRQLFIGVPLSLLAIYLCAALLAGAPLPLAIGAMLVCPAFTAALAWPLAGGLLAGIGGMAPITDAALTRPVSYLPLTYPFFIGMFLVACVCGFGLRFEALSTSPIGSTINIAVLVALAVVGGAATGGGPFDPLFSCSVVFALAGLLVAPIASQADLANALISTSYYCFSVVFNLVVITAAARNEKGAMLLFAWGNAVCAVASVVGANVGKLTGVGELGQGPTDVGLLASAALGTVLAAYVLLGMKRFSFASTIEGIEPDVALVVPGEGLSEERDFADSCALLASSKGLTPRETQIFGLLARGRNSAYIQEELGLTRNTVKTYIKHVYTKLEVHSQQELIDLASAVDPHADA